MDPARYARAKELFLQALDRPLADRGAFLDGACGGDDGLRADVDSLLRHHAAPSSDRFSQDVAGAVAEESASALAAASAASGAGFAGAPETVGPYRILGVLGEGGMGTVYEAEQQSPNRRVALKVARLGPLAADDLRLKLFEREVESLGRLRHPDIASIYESGHTDDGRRWLSMELIRGLTLDAWLADRPAGPPDAGELELRLRLFARIADAVNYAHQRGVIHRDIKPSNLVVVEDEEARGSDPSASRAPAVKVLDFGLARIADSEAPEVTRLSRAGQIRGTVPYMSPEQVRGNPDEIDLRSDVYSLGVVLYELIGRRLPHDLDRVPLPEAARILRDEPPRPLRGAPDAPRRLDPDLETVVGKALAKDPGDRYASAAALAADVQRWLGGLPILARPPSTLYQLRKLAARHRAPVAAALAALLLIAGFGVAMSVLYARSEANLRRAVAAEEDAHREAGTTREVLDFLVDIFRVSSPEEARGRDVTAREILDEGAVRITAELGGRPEVQATLLEAIGDVYANLGLYESARPMLEEALAKREAMGGEPDAEYARALDALAGLDRVEGRLDGVVERYARALEIRRRVLGPDHPDVALSLEHLAELRWQLGEPAEAESLIARALAIVEASLGPESARAASLNDGLGVVIASQGRLEEGAPYVERSVEIREHLLGGDHPDVAMGLANLGYIYRELQRWDDAERVLRRAVAIREKVLGPDHPDLANALNNLGLVYDDQKRWAESGELHRRALAIREKAFGPDHPSVAESLTNLAWDARGTGDYREAERLNRRALEIRREVFGPDHPLVKESLRYLQWLEDRKAGADGD